MFDPERRQLLLAALALGGLGTGAIRADDFHRLEKPVIVPTDKLVIVRRALDQLPREHRKSPWDLTREVLKSVREHPPQ